MSACWGGARLQLEARGNGAGQCGAVGGGKRLDGGFLNMDGSGSGAKGWALG